MKSSDPKNICSVFFQTLTPICHLLFHRSLNSKIICDTLNPDFPLHPISIYCCFGHKKNQTPKWYLEIVGSVDPPRELSASGLNPIAWNLSPQLSARSSVSRSVNSTDHSQYILQNFAENNHSFTPPTPITTCVQ